MQTTDPRVVLVTGGSSGFGKACIDHLAARGFRVYGTSRRAAFPEPGQASAYPQLLPMDVCDSDSVDAAVQFVVEREGRLDVLVNNAGIAIAGPVEQTSLDEAREQFETNFFGVYRLCRRVLPVMRAQGSGRIVNIGSIGGRVSIPFEGFYCASKAALAALTDALRMEVAPFGIQVTLLEPGDYKTGITANRRLAAGAADSVYADRLAATLAVIERDEQGGPDALGLALLLERVLAKRRVRPRYLVGMPLQRLAVWVQGAMPAAWFERIIASYYRV